MKIENKGITLTELVVSGVLISIILMGIMGFNASIKGIQNSTFRSSSLSSKVLGAITFIERDASLAVGDRNNPGVLWRDGTPAGVYDICFRHDGGDPNVYTDDSFVCYSLAAGDMLRRFDNPTVASTVASWPPATTVQALCGPGCETLDLVELEDADYFQVDVDGSSKLNRYIDFTITSLFDTGSGFNPMENPRYELTSRVNPMMHTR